MLTDRFADALAYAERLHRDQRRKGNDIPYVAHLLAVCATVLEWGGDEDVAIAALLHDAAEDQGGLAMLAEIQRRYGDRVAEIVAACSDSLSADPAAKAPWRERKLEHLRKLASVGADVALVTAADKLHNLQALIRDVSIHGPKTMDRFNAAPELIVAYHFSVAKALAAHKPTAPVYEIEEAVAQLAGLLGVPVGPLTRT